VFSPPQVSNTLWTLPSPLLVRPFVGVMEATTELTRAGGLNDV